MSAQRRPTHRERTPEPRSGRHRRTSPPPQRRSRAPRQVAAARAGISTYGRPRAQGRGSALLLVVLLVLGVLGAAAAFVFTRPVGATITVDPQDCTVAACSSEASGTLELGDLTPGVYPVRVTRPGYAPLDTTIDVRRFSANQFAFAMEPLPQTISLTTHPGGASCRVLADGVEVLSGTESLEGTLPAGPVTVEVALAGYNTFTRELFLDRTTALDVWLDPEGQIVSSRGILTSAGAPKGVQITPDGRELWATVLNGPPSVEIWDLETMRLAGTIDLGVNGAVEILFNRDGTKAYASQMETALVFEIDVATRAVSRTFDTESAWTKVVELSPDEQTLYAANWSGDDVSVIDLATGELRTRIRVADTPRGLYATEDGASLYVAGFGGGELQRIDLATGTVTDLFDSDGALRHIVGNDATGKLYISDMARDCIWLHDMATGETTKFTDTDEKPNTIDLSPDGKVLYVSCRGENNSVSYYIPGPEWGTILLFDAANATPLDAIVGGNQCTALDVADDGRTLVFSDFLDSRMRVYAVPEFDVLAAGNGGRWEQHFADLVK